MGDADGVAVDDCNWAAEILGDAPLRAIAHDLVTTVRQNTSTDWTLRESAQARLRIMVKRILRQRGFPPDEQELATLTVLQQAELFARDWAA